MLRVEIYTYKVKLAKHIVLSILASLTLYCDYHPLIISVEVIDDGKVKVVEQPFNWLPIKVNYDAQSLVKGDQVEFEFSKILRMFQPHFEYSITDSSDGYTFVQLTISVSGFPLGRRLLIKKMDQAQQHLWSSAERNGSI